MLLVVVACGTAPPAEPAVAPTGEQAAQPTPALTPALTQTPTPSPGNVHQAEGASRWYPSDPDDLQAAVDGYIGSAEIEPIPGRLLGLIVPHAGYVYSGEVAGYAFRALQEAGCDDRTVVVIGDTHTGNGQAQIAVWASGAFETPLGRMPVAEETAQAIVAADPRIQFDREAFNSEHPVENQLPFIQAVCPGARIVPVVVRQASLQNAQVLADALVAALGQEPAFIVASTDLSHYFPYAQARQIDEVALQAIVSLDPQAVADSSRRCTELGIAANPGTMCSQGAVMAAMLAAGQMGADGADVLHYANSGDTPIGQREQVVGYGAVALWQSDGEEGSDQFDMPADAENLVEPLALSPEAQEELLALARRSAEQFLSSETFPPFHTEDPALLQPLGAFVTYERDGALRGCVGRVEGDRPVYLNVQYAAAAAAVADSRFPPITPEELEGLSIEITLLHPMRQVQSPDEIEIGRDGILMRVGEEGGALFLPQVPLDEGWDLEATLIHLSRKAGLPDDAWRSEGARFYVFAGEWFGDEE
jgi:AmmeMemoRadiSam system protein B/AmmeMemoRadiSam system protein A